jgi:protein-disulfide isomerase
MEVEPKLIAEFVETGRVRLIYRHLAQISQDSLVSAEAMHCAAEQGQYWQMRRTLYERQSDLYGTGSIEGALTFIAADLGMEQQAFGTCLSSRKYQAAVEADIEASMAAGVRGRPTFEINGQRIVGARSYEDFATLLSK